LTPAFTPPSKQSETAEHARVTATSPACLVAILSTPQVRSTPTSHLLCLLPANQVIRLVDLFPSVLSNPIHTPAPFVPQVDHALHSFLAPKYVASLPPVPIPHFRRFLQLAHFQPESLAHQSSSVIPPTPSSSSHHPHHFSSTHHAAISTPCRTHQFLAIQSAHN
jgi:hypothetical protein